MADERCVFPEDHSRAPGRWLDRDVAERLLRGEPLEGVDADTRARADRLAEALGSLGSLGSLATLTAETTPPSTELPGEAAALAAFRAARTDRSGEEASLGAPARTQSSHPSPSSNSSSDSAASPAFSDMDLVRIGRSGTGRRASLWGRPLRYGIAAALTAGMIGGVAMAATAGVLAFGGDEPEPGASATVAVTPDRPFITPSPDNSRDSDEPRPDGGGAGAPTGESSAPRGEAREDTGAGTGTGAQPDSDDTGREKRPGQRWARLASACRDYRDGKNLDSGRRRTLEDAARGAEQVHKYCKAILKNGDRRDSDDGWRDPRPGHGGSGEGGSGRGDNGGGGGGHGGGDHDGDGDGDGHSHIGAGTFRHDSGVGEPTGFTPGLPQGPEASRRTAAPQVGVLRADAPPKSPADSPADAPQKSPAVVNSPAASVSSGPSRPVTDAPAAPRRLPALSSSSSSS